MKARGVPIALYKIILPYILNNTPEIIEKMKQVKKAIKKKSNKKKIIPKTNKKSKHR